MLQALRNKQREDGFTLIELMVVVLIIAILIAIAVPTFLGARERSQDKAAQSDLRNALTAAKVIYTDNSDYQEATVTALAGVEPSLSFVAVGSADKDNVGVNAESATLITFVKQSDAGNYFCISDDLGTSGGTTFGKDAALANVDDNAGCTGGW